MKRFFSNLNIVMALVLAFVLVQMINFIALRNPVRVDWSDSKYYALSDKTQGLLQQVDEPLEVVAICQNEFVLYDDIKSLLEEYQYLSRHMDVKWVDPVRDRSQAEKLATKYGLVQAPVIVFVYKGRHKAVALDDFAEYTSVKNRKDPVLSAFKGEQAFSSAIQGLMQENNPVVYFLAGHGERSVNNFEPQGYSKIGAIIQGDNIEIKELLLANKTGVPDDASLLVVAGPTKMMSKVEAEMIEAYLNRNGRVMLLLDALIDTGLEDMVRRWGVGLRNDYVRDPKNTQKGGDVYVREYYDHEITKKMTSMGARFHWPRSVEPLPTSRQESVAEDRPTVSPLARTSEESWSETQLDQVPPKYDENSSDLKGSFSLAVAVERGASKQSLDVQIEPTRMVIFGDSDFVTNAAISGGDQDLFMSALNWLLNREELMAIAPKPIEMVKLNLTQQQLKQLLGMGAAGIPTIAVVAGLLVWFLRRK